ncbi:ribonuclease HI [Actinomadura craniellae]|nr:RNase H family protein [Actinomadura craniellae]
MSDTPWLTVAEFENSLSLLPGALRERAVALRPHLFRPRRNRDVAEFVRLAFDAAYLKDLPAATEMMGRAESLVARLPPPSPAPPPTSKPLAIMYRGLRGLVPGQERSGPLIAATDASAKKGGRRRRGDLLGWAYITTDGRWGCGGRIFEGRLNPHRRGGALSGELRAVHMMLEDLTDVPQMTVLTDSQGAISYLRRWQAGEVGAMPEGYSMRPRTASPGRSGKPTLARLAELVAERPRLRFEHVTGHTGHPLNEAADSLSRFARRCVGGEQTGDRTSLTEHASDLAGAFLAAWHDQAATDSPPHGRGDVRRGSTPRR